jgi:hypothetical protein
MPVTVQAGFGENGRCVPATWKTFTGQLKATVR